MDKVNTLLDPVSKTLKIRIILPNDDGLLKPDMFASIKVHTPTSQKYLTIPTKALVFDNNKYMVVIAKTDTTFVQIAEKKKPPLPMRYNISPYSVTWEDKEYNTSDLNYRILSYDKKGKEICELKVIWENK